VPKKGSEKPRCSGITSSGKRCSHTVSNPGDLCHSHHPDKAERRREIASQGGKLSRKGNPAEEIVDLRHELRSVADEVKRGKLTTARGAVVAQVLGVLLRTFEQQRRQAEHDELRKEVEELKARFATRTLENDSVYGSGYWSR
jgi:hypothetical protein